MAKFPYRAASQQEMFNNVWQHYVVEGQPLGFNGVGCEYKIVQGEQEVRCAIGLHLTDFALSKMEKQLDIDENLHHTPVTRVLLKGDITEGFVTELQRTHDYAARYKTNIRSALLAFAERWGLTIPTKGG